MEKISTLVYGVVCLVVMVLIISTTVIPVIDDAKTEQSTIVQQTGAKYSVASISESLTIGYDADNSIPTINNQKITDLYPTPPSERLFIISDVSVAVVSYTNNAWSTWSITSPAIENQYYTITISSATASASFESGTFTVTDGTYTYTSQYKFLLSPSNDGKYGAWSYTDLPLFIDSKKSMYVMQRVNALQFVASGTVDDLKVQFAIVSSTPVQDATLTAVYEPTEFEASNKLTTMNATGITLASSTVVFLPLEYKTITESQNMIITLLAIIPLILLMVPVIYAARMVTVGRD